MASRARVVPNTVVPRISEGSLMSSSPASIQEKIRLVRPLRVPQSSSRTMTSWETSTRRRVR